MDQAGGLNGHSHRHEADGLRQSKEKGERPTDRQHEGIAGDPESGTDLLAVDGGRFVNHDL